MGATTADPKTASPWGGFKSGLWQKEINVRDFIQQNYTPYDGDESFLALATARTKNLWARLSELFVEERKKGVLDISQIPSSNAARTSSTPALSRYRCASCGRPYSVRRRMTSRSSAATKISSC
jgi:pyruvate-formate lyase